MTDKALAIHILMLLSALESWAYANNTKLPEHYVEQLGMVIHELTQEVLK